MDNFDLKKYLVENKVTANSKMLNEDTNINESNGRFEEIAAQLTSMVSNGEIDNNDIDQLIQNLTSARRKMFAGKKSPEEKAASSAKGQMTIKRKKLEKQAAGLTNQEMGITDLADSLALKLGSHIDGALQAKWTQKYNQILSNLSVED
jgi:hypothetical protein